MNLPEFTAEASLYKTSANYHCLTGSERMTRGVLSSGWNLTFGSEVAFVTTHRGSIFATCGALGKPCCRAPFQNVPAFGPLVSCDRGLGCDITTGTCVAPCGGPGQPCCDGPETRAPKWRADGTIYSPNYWNMQEMCNKGACHRQTHRCFACGTQDGAPCCPPDAAHATARCLGRSLECEFDPQGFALSGTCRACGSRGKPPCHWGCEAGLDIRNGRCDICGDEGQPPCDGGCNRPFTVQGGVCRWVPPPPPSGFAVGVVSGGTNCGASGQKPCANGCNQGLIVRNGLCATPQAPPEEPCANLGEECVPEWNQGTHCCQRAGFPTRCLYKKCQVCIPHGEEVPEWGPQLCCTVGEVPIWDQFLEKAVCGIVSPPEK